MNALELRKALKKKKPTFIRQEGWKKKKFKNSPKWRRPKGIHSKMRRMFKGRHACPSQGWRSPKEVRGLHPSGLIPVIVRNEKELSKIKENSGIIIAATVGKKKRLQIAKKAIELGIKVVNIDPKRFVEKVEQELKEKTKKKEAEAKIRKEEPKPVKETKKPEETPEEKKEREKREKEKILTKREL